MPLESLTVMTALWTGPRATRHLLNEAPTSGLTDEDLNGFVSELLSSWHSCRASVDRRIGHRIRWTGEVELQPLTDNSDVPAEEPMLVVAKDLSTTGLAFVHRKPLVCKQAAVRFETPDGTIVRLKLKLTWSRFRSNGLYESGGQFQGLLPLQWPKS